MHLATRLLWLGAALLPIACSGGQSARTLASVCRDYCTAREAAACPKPDCAGVCTRDLAACPSGCLDAMAALMDCAAAQCGADAGLALCAAEVEAAAACSPACG